MPRSPQKTPSKRPAKTPAKTLAKGPAAAPAATSTKASAKTTVRSRARTAPALGASAKSVAVRMYRGILGDCFLIATEVEGVRKHILIDCGVLQSVPSGAELARKLPDAVRQQPALARLGEVVSGNERIKAVVADIQKATGGVIDLVVVTHEHFDHLSGFALGQELFEKMAFNEVWMAWTEDPADEKGQALRARFKQAKATLKSAVEVGLKLGLNDERLAMADALSAFIGPGDDLGGAPSGTSGKVRTTRDMIDFVRSRAPSGKVVYLSPGQVVDKVKELGLKAFVLGPPRNDARLGKDTPSAGAAKEVYLTGNDEIAAVQAAIDALRRSRADELGAAAPVEGAAQAAAGGSPFARPFLLGDKVGSWRDSRWALNHLYRAEPRRRIEDEWMGGLEALALKMDTDTNNTSLALAFELSDGQVLLFAGDAQVGNWLSWYDQTYPATPKTDEKATSIEDLLRRVVFYKVGHHGSHNATLAALGLQKMTCERLTAAIPVVEAVAAVQGKGRTAPGEGWSMPFGALYADLQARTSGRIVRGDGDPSAEQSAFAASKPEQGRASVSYETKAGGLWVTLTFPVG